VEEQGQGNGEDILILNQDQSIWQTTPEPNPEQNLGQTAQNPEQNLGQATPAPDQQGSSGDTITIWNTDSNVPEEAPAAEDAIVIIS